jgi:signal peptidase I
MASDPQADPAIETKPRRWGIALVLSLLFPGWGQIYNGQLGKALWIWCVWIVANLCAVAAGLPLTFPGLLAMLLAGIAFYVVVGLEAIVCARRLSLRPDRFKPNRWYAYLGLTALVYTLSLSAAVASRRFFFQAYKIPAGSMEPTLLIGDHIVVDKRPKTLHRGDVIVFRFPPDPTKDFVKRVIAVGGDSIEIRKGVAYLNGEQIPDPPAHLDPAVQDRSSSSPRDNFGPVAVPAGKLFVLGDSRDHSYDSRFWGFVDETDVEGRVHYIYWSLEAESSSVKHVRWERIGKSVQ